MHNIVEKKKKYKMLDNALFIECYFQIHPSNLRSTASKKEEKNRGRANEYARISQLEWNYNCIMPAMDNRRISHFPPIQRHKYASELFNISLIFDFHLSSINPSFVRFVYLKCGERKRKKDKSIYHFFSAFNLWLLNAVVNSIRIR